MNQQDVFASIEIITFNPILKESMNIRKQYFVYLRRLIRLARWNKRKYTKAQIAFYKDKLCGEQEILRFNQRIDLESSFCYLLPFDLMVMSGFNEKIINPEKITTIINRIVSDFHLPPESNELLAREFETMLGNEKVWHEVLQQESLKYFRKYLKIVKENMRFIKKRPYNMLITATMSAGKSTLINALVGKNISLMQNMACTSKIHTIISKPLEDGVISEYDHDILINASKEDLLSDNDGNKSYKIMVGTYFNSILGGKRIILFDSPGVNSSENFEHMEISRRMIRSRKYQLLIYVLNATQLGTTDEEQHLEVVAKFLGRAKVIFVMNKIEHLISEDDNVLDVIERQRKFLILKGFKYPLICPISARAAYLAKKSQQEKLSRIEQREIENSMDKFEAQSLAGYYEGYLNCTPLASTHNETQRLFKNCGFAYFEKILEHFTNGGKINDTGLC